MTFMFWDFRVPYQIARVSTPKEIIRLTNLYNGLQPCYLSCNPYEIVGIDEFGNEIKKTSINLAFFDFDNDVDGVRKLVTFLMKEDIKFRLHHSGNGHHVFVYCEGKGNGSNLRILQLSLLEKAGTFCDPHVIGDVQRICRIPNTWNFKSASFCVPITIDEIEKGNFQEQRFFKKEYGTKLLNLEDYTEENFEYLKPLVVPNLQISSDIPLIPCIRNIISKNNPCHNDRWLLAVYLSYTLREGKDLWNFDSKMLIEKIMEYMNNTCSHWLDYDSRKTKYYLLNIIPKFNPMITCDFIKKKNACIGCVKEK